MSELVSYVIAVCVCSAFTAPASIDAAPQGFLEGKLKIVSRTPVELEGENNARESTAATAETYASYPLVVLSRGERKQIAQITADRNGNYRVALAPGDYILDAEGRVPRRLHARAHAFTIVPNETVHVDITINVGFGAERSAS